jgi:hypothetical protein
MLIKSKQLFDYFYFRGVYNSKSDLICKQIPSGNLQSNSLIDMAPVYQFCLLLFDLFKYFNEAFFQGPQSQSFKF